jgi:predicted secreted protein
MVVTVDAGPPLMGKGGQSRSGGRAPGRVVDESERAVEQQPRREVVVGDVVELTVSDLPGAGYRWEVPAVPPGLTLVEGEWVQDEPPPGVGAGRARVLRLRADQAGEYVVRLELRRPWEAVPARVSEVPVSVTAAGRSD